MEPRARRRGLIALGVLLASCAAMATEPLKVGSKRFTESYILGEIIARAAGRAGAVEHRPGLGNTGILYAALRAGAIDLYPEYTGTIAREILKIRGDPDLAAINAGLAPLGLAAGVPLGFNNGYALGMREDVAARLAVRAIGDLRGHPGLRPGFSQEFLGRADGWPGLAKAYGLAAFKPLGLDHGLAYEALASARIDVMDLYTTDAKIRRYRIRTLADEQRFFPRYDAVLLYRAEVPVRFAPQWGAIAALEGSISAQRMIRMNEAAELQGRSFREAAGLYFQNAAAEGATIAPPRGILDALLAPDLGRLTREHLVLVFGSLAAGIALGVPLGVAARRRRALGELVFGAVGVVQTIPALALLAFLIALTGTIGVAPAMTALFLYALLPIVRNTHAGLAGVGEAMRQAALALGLTPRERLWLVELPLARPMILTGIKTSTVVNVGTATIAAFIGAGGYGERIAAGLALNDTDLLLAGAIPAAVLALLVQGGFEVLERAWDPLRGSSGV